MSCRYSPSVVHDAVALAIQTRLIACFYPRRICTGRSNVASRQLLHGPSLLRLMSGALQREAQHTLPQAQLLCQVSLQSSAAPQNPSFKVSPPALCLHVSAHRSSKLGHAWLIKQARQQNIAPQLHATCLRMHSFQSSAAAGTSGVRGDKGADHCRESSLRRAAWPMRNCSKDAFSKPWCLSRPANDKDADYS